MDNGPTLRGAATVEHRGVVVWDVDGTLIPADLRWLRRAIAETYALAEEVVVFPTAKVHGYTDESIVVEPPYPGAKDSIAALHGEGFIQTVLTGNLRAAAEANRNLRRSFTPT